MSIEYIVNNNTADMSVSKKVENTASKCTHTKDEAENISESNVATTSNKTIKSSKEENINESENDTKDERKARLVSSSDSGKGNSNELSMICNNDSQSYEEILESSATRSRSTTSSGDLPTVEKLQIAESKLNEKDVKALLEPTAVAQGSGNDKSNRTLSWVRSCPAEGYRGAPNHNYHQIRPFRQFSDYLDVKTYYRNKHGDKFVEEALDRMKSIDKYERRINYDPDQPAAGTENDMEYKFYLEKMLVKKLIGAHGENSEMLRAANQVDFYVSRDQDDESEFEIVTVRGSWENVRQTIVDIKSMINSLGFDAPIEHINTAVKSNEFLLQNSYTTYFSLRLNTLENVTIVGAQGTLVLMQINIDGRYNDLKRMDEELNIVYGLREGWDQLVTSPPERVPLPINDRSIVVAPGWNDKFYRALVESSDIENGTATVWFLDWGGRSTVSVHDLFKLHNRFTALPYFLLFGRLAGCSVPAENEERFGYLLFDLIRRYMPVKVEAKQKGPDGLYTILLYGNGGEVINHLLIDQKLVGSEYYILDMPFSDYIHMEKYNPDKKMVERTLFVVVYFGSRTYYVEENCYQKMIEDGQSFSDYLEKQAEYDTRMEEYQFQQQQHQQHFDRSVNYKNYHRQEFKSIGDRPPFLSNKYKGKYMRPEQSSQDGIYKKYRSKNVYAYHDYSPREQQHSYKKSRFRNGNCHSNQEEQFMYDHDKYRKYRPSENIQHPERDSQNETCQRKSKKTDSDKRNSSSENSEVVCNGDSKVQDNCETNGALIAGDNGLKISENMPSNERKALPCENEAVSVNDDQIVPSKADSLSASSNKLSVDTEAYDRKNVTDDSNAVPSVAKPTCDSDARQSVWTSEQVSKSNILRPKDCSQKSQLPESSKTESDHPSESSQACSKSTSAPLRDSSHSSYPTSKSVVNQNYSKSASTSKVPSEISDSTPTPKTPSASDDWTVVTSKKRRNNRRGRY